METFYNVFKKKSIFFALKKLKKPPQKVAYLWQLGGSFLCSPDCTKQPRTSYPFCTLFYPIVSAKVSDTCTLLITNHFYKLFIGTEDSGKDFFFYVTNILSKIGLKKMYFNCTISDKLTEVIYNINS